MSRSLNGFRVEIPEGVGSDCEGHVYIDHGRKFRIPYGQTVTIERSANDSGCFTAYAEASWQAESIGIDRNSEDLGLVEVTFRSGRYKNHVRNPQIIHETPITQYEIYRSAAKGFDCSYTPRSTTRSYCAASLCGCEEPAGMGIGLSGESDQHFTDADNLVYEDLR